MGVESYDRKALMNQRQEKGKRAFAARQTAAMTSRNRNSADEEQSVEDTGREKGIGFFGWLGGLFSEDIVFWFHETQIKGKSGRQVRGGAVPLFDGVILDLTPASMVGEAEGERQVVRPLEGGSQAKLIVRPARRGFTAEHAIHNFVITAPKNGKADGFSAEIREQITYDLGAGVQLQARGAAICEGLVVLDGASLTGVRGSGEIGGAVINEGGIMITPKADSESSDIKEKAQEALEHKPDENQSLEGQLTEVYALEEKVSENKAAESGSSETKSSESGTTESTASESRTTNSAASENKATESTATENKITESTAPENKPSEEKLSEERPTGDKEDAEDKKDEDDGKDGEDDEDDDGGDGTKITLNLSELAGSVESDGNKLAVNGKEGSVEFQKDDLEGNANFRQKTFKISWGKDWSSEDDEEEGEETEADEKKEEKTDIKETLKESYETLKGNGVELLDKAGFAKDALVTFLETGKLPENKFLDEGGEEKKVKVPLVQIEVIPGLSFEAFLVPEWSFGIHFEFGAKEGEEGEKTGAEEKTEDGRVTDIQRILYLTAEVKGSIGAMLKLILSMGAGYILSLNGELFARGRAHGTLDQSEDVFGRGDFQIPVRMRGKEITVGKAELELDAGIGLSGTIGANLNVASTIFAWEKELCGYSLKEWTPLDLQGQLKLKQTGEKSLFNSQGWKLEESSFSFQCFKEKIEGSSRYGIRMYQLSDEAKALIEKGKTTAKTIGDLHEKLDAIKKEIGENGGQFGAPGNEAYRKLTDEIQGITDYLSYTLEVGTNAYEGLEKEIDKVEKSETYQTSYEKAKKKYDTHNTRYEGMQEWGNQFEGNEKERNEKAYSYYKETFHAKRAARQQGDAREEAARRRLATKENLIAYEELRIKALGKEYDKRIQSLQTDMSGMSEDEKGKANPKFLEAYRWGNEGELFDKWQRYAGKQRILEYEEGRRNEYKSKHVTRYNKLVAKAEELNISDRTKPNRKFAEYYYNDKEMKARRFFSKEELLHHHQNGEKIVAYEKARLEDKSGEYMTRVNMLSNYKKTYDQAEGEEEKAKVLEAAKQYYAAAGGRLGNKYQWNINIAKAASKEEILAYETKKADIDRNAKVPEDYKIAKRALEILKEKGPAVLEKEGVTILTDKGKKESKNQGYVDNLCRIWLSKNLKADSELLEEVTPLEVLYAFEKGRIYEVDNEIRRNTITMGAKREGILNRKRAESAEYQKRLGRWQRLGQLIASTGNMSGDLKESMIQDEKKKYFNEYFTGEEGMKDRELLMKRLTKGSALSSPELLRVVLERKLEEFGGAHKERAEKLRELMDPKEGKNASITDAQVWEEYRNMGAGRGFADAYAEGKKKNKNYTIEEMLRYEQTEAREHSGKNAFKAFLQNSAEKKLKKNGEEEVEKKKELAKGGHYDRYNTLKEKLDGGASDREITELYIKLSNGGAGYVEFLMEDKLVFDVVTPKEILDYEENCSGKKGEKHDDRLEKLKELGETLSDEEFYDKYRKMVLEESVGREILDHVAGVKIGFDDWVKAEDVLTPQILLKHEEQSRAEALRKHTDRLEMLRKDDVTDENALQKYKEAGGEKGFFDAKTVALGWTMTEMGSSADFQNILDYEDKRRKNYENALKELKKPLEKLEQEKQKLKEKLKQAKIDIDDAETLLAAYTDQNNPAYESKEKFGELVDVATGPESQKKAKEGTQRIAEISTAVSEEHMPALEQLQAAQLDLMLMDEDQLLRNED